LREIKLMNEARTGSVAAFSWQFVRYKGNARKDWHGHKHGKPGGSRRRFGE